MVLYLFYKTHQLLRNGILKQKLIFNQGFFKENVGTGYNLQGPNFSDSKYLIFSDSRYPNRVPKTPQKNMIK